MIISHGVAREVSRTIPGDRKMEKYVIKDTGAILTDEMIEFLAAEAEEGYDLSLGEVVHIGRSPT